MKSLAYAILAAVVLSTSLTACGGIKQESAMQWLQSQPMRVDNP